MRFSLVQAFEMVVQNATLRAPGLMRFAEHAVR